MKRRKYSTVTSLMGLEINVFKMRGRERVRGEARGEIDGRIGKAVYTT